MKKLSDEQLDELLDELNVMARNYDYECGLPMNSSGIVRSVDSLGRFVLPKELRDSFGITTDTPIEIFTDGNTILLRKYRADGCCDLCGEVTGDSILFRGKRICAACRKELAKL